MCELARLRLPQDCLEKLVCADCKGFLSTGPVKLRTNGESLCGKCTSRMQIGSPPLVSHTAFDEVIRLVDFPCIYRNSGCTEYITFDDPKGHEATCCFKLYNCPAGYALCIWSGTMAQIPQHYRESHPELVMLKPKFEINQTENTELVRLFVTCGFLFYVKVKISVDVGRMWIKVEHAMSPDSTQVIKYKLVLHTGELDSLEMALKEQVTQAFHTTINFDEGNSQSVDLRAVQALLEEPTRLYCNMIYKIPNELIVAMKKTLNDIKCPHCRIFMAPPIYKCGEGHPTCVDCVGYKNKCKECKTDAIFSRQVDLEVVSASNLLACRWAVCQNLFNASEIRKHETICEHRVYNCPRCYKWRGSRANLVQHFAETHDTHPLHENAGVSVEGGVRVYDFYVLAFGEVFGGSVFPNEDSGKNVSVWYYGSPTFRESFRYFVDLRCCCQEVKRYQLQPCCPYDTCYSFNLKISNEDLEHFVNHENYEVQFRVVEAVLE